MNNRRDTLGVPLEDFKIEIEFSRARRFGVVATC